MCKPYFSLWFFPDIFSYAYYHGSSRGLFFIFLRLLPRIMCCPKLMLRNFSTDLIVCNPFTGRTKSIRAPDSSTSILSQGIVATECDDNRQTYKVVAVCQVPGGVQGAGKHDTLIQSVKIYDSSVKSWTTARYVPDMVSKTGLRMLFSDRYFYCKVILSECRGIFGLRMKNDSSLFAPLTYLVNGIMFHHLCKTLQTQVPKIQNDRKLILRVFGGELEEAYFKIIPNVQVLTDKTEKEGGC
jgi:hypothetical protein